VSPIGLDEVQLDAFFAAIDTPAVRAWLTGVAYGPGIHISQKQMIERLPEGYVLRQYPDITHSLAAMCVCVDHWSLAGHSFTVASAFCQLLSWLLSCHCYFIAYCWSLLFQRWLVFMNI
jgi:hypothetical protein